MSNFWELIPKFVGFIGETLVGNRDILATPILNSNLDMENITDEYYMHRKRVCRKFEVKNLGEYHNLYVKHDNYF